MKNFQNIMKQAQEMQERLQRKMNELRIETTAGGGMVRVVMNGTKQVLSLILDREVVNPGDLEMLQDLIVSAVNEASRKVDEELARQVGGLTGGLQIPGM